MNRDTPWTRLDPARARYGAQWGRYVGGVVLLEHAAGVTICGAMTCNDRASAEHHAESYRGSRRDLDGGAVSLATFRTWAAS